MATWTHRAMLALALLGLHANLGAQQVRIGQRLDPVEIENWLKRSEAQQNDASPRFLTFLPHSRQQFIRTVRGLQSLQGEFRRRIAVLAVVPAGSERLAEIPLRHSMTEISIAGDPGDALRARFQSLVLYDDVPWSVLVDREGVLVWCGSWSSSVRHLLSDWLAGSLGGEQMEQLVDLTEVLDQNRRGRGAYAEHLAAELREARVRHWAPWVALLMSELVRGEAQLRILAQGLDALSNRPAYQGRLLAEVLRHEPSLARNEELARRVELLLSYPCRDPELGLAGFEFHAARSEWREASSWAVRCIDVSKGSARQLEFLRGRLRHHGGGTHYVEQELLALDLALQSGGLDFALLSAKFGLLVDRGDSLVAADRVGRKLIALRAEDVAFLNAFAWRLMTEDRFGGGLDELALAAAEKMRQVEEWETYWRLDTLGLALFRNGRVAEAVEAQEGALALADGSSRGRYATRLDRYRQQLQVATPNR